MDDIIGILMETDDRDHSNSKNSFGNHFVELMNYDTYTEEWCTFSDQTCPILSPFDESSSIEQYYDSRIPIEDGCTVVATPSIPRSPTHSFADKVLRAMHFYKELNLGGCTLAQVWVPLKIGDHCVLSTCEQPYLLDGTLSGYREVSTLFTFPTESSRPGSFPGLPGRVFMSKMPEWTSNVMYYSKTEFLRVEHAVDYQVRGSIALPVFEDDSCRAVLELVTTKEKSDFDSEMDNVCRALQAVNLTSTLPPRLNSQSLSMNQRAALSEITNVLQVICRTHKLPLALTWVPCSYNERRGHDIVKVMHTNWKDKSPNEKCVLCIEDTACYWNDKCMQGYVNACVGQFLEEGQGIVGKALQSNNPLFFSDVKEYHISEYPLVHHARKFGLNAAVAIRLRSTYTGDDDYVLEFFLPVNMNDSEEQQFFLNDLSITMQKICKSLRRVSEAELLWNDSENVLQSGEEKNLSPVSLSLKSTYYTDQKVPQDTRELRKTESKGVVDNIPQQIMIGSSSPIEHKRSIVEKHISLNVLQQHFSGSLKDAAKSLGVCPTTLKRICRQHGILRWPSRKINKVNRTLEKIQKVLESVHGVQGALEFDSTTGRLVAVGSITKEPVESHNSFLFPTKNSLDFNRELGSVVQNASSSQAISFVDFKDVDTRGREEPTSKEYSLVKSGDGSQLVALHHCTPSWPNSLISTMPYASNLTHDDQMKIKLKDEHDEQGIEHSQLTSINESGSTSSSGSFDQNPPHKVDAYSYGDSSGSKITVKATYKCDTIRFKFEPIAGCFKLYEEVGKRFNLGIEDFQLRYLDDEEEWVMLVSDSDLHECLDILNVSETRTVKFLVRDMQSSSATWICDSGSRVLFS